MSKFVFFILLTYLTIAKQKAENKAEKNVQKTFQTNRKKLNFNEL